MKTPDPTFIISWCVNLLTLVITYIDPMMVTGPPLDVDFTAEFQRTMTAKNMMRIQAKFFNSIRGPHDE